MLQIILIHYKLITSCRFIIDLRSFSQHSINIIIDTMFVLTTIMTIDDDSNNNNNANENVARSLILMLSSVYFFIILDLLGS